MQKKLVHKIWPIRSNALSRSPFIPNKLKNKVNFLRVEYTVMISEQMVTDSGKAAQGSFVRVARVGISSKHLNI